jgi:methylated-DNA-[protein]-cysteine S-methyltransferase
MPETFYTKRYNSPLGVYVLVSSQQGIVCVKPEEQMKTDSTRWERDGITLEDRNEYTGRLAEELDSYFAGKLRQFSIPLDLRGTEFQLQVWEYLYSIPYGETRSYGQVAHAIGRPTASRAVGRANGTNPVSIVVPCHRVIGVNGKLVGYGGGLDRKQALLDLEAKVFQKNPHTHH